MRKFLFVSFFMLLAGGLFAQADSLKQYTGKFHFPEGTPFAEVVVSLDSTGTLTAATSLGNSPLKKTSGDVFEVVAYGGTATFRRNDLGKIVAVRVQVSDIDAEGTKEETEN